MKNIQNLLQNIKSTPVISLNINYSQYIHLDLSITNSKLVTENLNTAKDYELYIQKQLNQNQAKIAYGGYLETRNLYQRSNVFKNTNTPERNIHIGLDLWINNQAPIFAPIAGKIHSFKNNTALGDYGPTIILEHQVDSFTFYTLYGHLSTDSIANINIGDIILQGQQIATLGLPPINGDYAPHLHFQIIIDLQNNFGDYPGVCATESLEFYKINCPDPNLLLKIYPVK